MSFRFDISLRLYKQVAANSAETLDYTPANGERVFIVNVGVSSSSVPDTVSCVAWDPAGNTELIMTSYNEAEHRDVNQEFVGDGVKILRIQLQNDLNEPAYMGAYVQAMKL